MYNSTAYARHLNLPKPKGIMIHSSIIHNPYLKHYIRPTSKNENLPEVNKKIGYNKHFLDYNHTHRTHNFHFGIGKDNKNKILTMKTLPENIRSGSRDSYIHICICEDKLKNKKYLNDCLRQAILLCKELCKKYSGSAENVFYYSNAINDKSFQYGFEKYGYTQDGFKALLQNKLDKEKNF